VDARIDATRKMSEGFPRARSTPRGGPRPPCHLLGGGSPPWRNTSRGGFALGAWLPRVVVQSRIEPGAGAHLPTDR
jgi:hypothetical protein